MMNDFPKPPFPTQKQPMPGTMREMDPVPDYGEQSYRGSGRLTGKKALITGADSGIGRAVALAFAREGADVCVSYLSEDEDARETQRVVEAAGRKCLLIPGDVANAAHCRSIVEMVVEKLGAIDVLVNNAAHQMSFTDIGEISDEEWDRTFATNISSMFYLSKAAVKHMRPGSSIINTASINADSPSPQLLAYATTKGAIQNFSGGLAQLLAEKGIRVNAVAPGPIWTPLQVVGGQQPNKLPEFGANTPMGRPGQPVELAPIYVQLASAEPSYSTGQVFGATGGRGGP